MSVKSHYSRCLTLQSLPLSHKRHWIDRRKAYALAATKVENCGGTQTTCGPHPDLELDQLDSSLCDLQWHIWTKTTILHAMDHPHCNQQIAVSLCQQKVNKGLCLLPDKHSSQGYLKRSELQANILKQYLKQEQRTMRLAAAMYSIQTLFRQFFLLLCIL